MTLTFLLPPSIGPSKATARAEFAAARLERDLGEQVRVEVAGDYGDMIGMLRVGAADMVWAPTVVCTRLGRPRALFKAVRQGRSTYRSAVIVRRDRHLDLASLRGARAAWVDRDSVGGYRLAVHALLHRGIDAASAFARQDFLGSYPAVVEAVLDGSADVGAVYVPEGDTFAVERALEEHRGARGVHTLQALLVSPPVPNDVLAITETVPVERAAALESRLFPPGPRGAIALGRPASLCLVMEADGFERMTPAEYDALRAMLV